MLLTYSIAERQNKKLLPLTLRKVQVKISCDLNHKQQTK